MSNYYVIKKQGLMSRIFLRRIQQTTLSHYNHSITAFHRSKTSET